jgi:hypothetical protein
MFSKGLNKLTFNSNLIIRGNEKKKIIYNALVNIEPRIQLNKDIPIEQELIDCNKNGNLDTKNLLIIGHLAINAARQYNKSNFDYTHILEQNAQREKEIAVLQERTTYLSRLELQLKSEIEALKEENKSLQKDFIKILRDEDITALKAQIASLKGSSFSKGIVGETMVKNIMQNTFRSIEIIDKSGCRAESDIHIVREHDNRIVAIECKNKNRITYSDVSKSIRDIHFLKEKYGDNFIGYIFLSLRTSNIPKKGVSMEVICNTPVIWFGADCEEKTSFDSFTHTLPVLVKIIWNLADRILVVQNCGVPPLA